MDGLRKIECINTWLPQPQLEKILLEAIRYNETAIVRVMAVDTIYNCHKTTLERIDFISQLQSPQIALDTIRFHIVFLLLYIVFTVKLKKKLIFKKKCLFPYKKLFNCERNLDNVRTQNQLRHKICSLSDETTA